MLFRRGSAYVQGKAFPLESTAWLDRYAIGHGRADGY